MSHAPNTTQVLTALGLKQGNIEAMTNTMSSGRYPCDTSPDDCDARTRDVWPRFARIGGEHLRNEDLNDLVDPFDQVVEQTHILQFFKIFMPYRNAIRV